MTTTELTEWLPPNTDHGAVGRLDQLVTPNHQSTSLEVHTYYRAKTFVCQPGLNPLLSAAGPLLTLLSRIKQAKQYDDVDELFNSLTHEINAFCSTAERNQYTDKHIVIARYLIAATLDDAILSSRWGRKSWTPDRLRDYFFTDKQSHEQILHIIGQLINGASDHIDLLEFVYVCLRLGYRAQFKKSNAQMLVSLQQQLYEVTQSFREKQQPITSNDLNKPLKKISFRHSLALSIICGVLLSTLHYGANFLMDENATIVSQQLNDIQQIQKV